MQQHRNQFDIAMDEIKEEMIKDFFDASEMSFEDSLAESSLELLRLRH